MESHISESSGGGEVARGDRDMGTEKWDVLSEGGVSEAFRGKKPDSVVSRVRVCRTLV